MNIREVPLPRPPRRPEEIEDDLAEALHAVLLRLPGPRTADCTHMPSWVVLRAHEAMDRWLESRGRRWSEDWWFER